MPTIITLRRRLLWPALTLALPLWLAACNSAPSTSAPAAATVAPTTAAAARPAQPTTAAVPTQAATAPSAPSPVATSRPAAAPTTPPAAPTTAPSAPPPAATTAPVAPTAAPPSSAAKTTGLVKLNLNTATREQFLTVPNVGDRMVREFLEYRPYASIQQFRREIGKYVNQEQVRQYEQYVFVPIDTNRADAETLKQLPGVDDADAAALIAARPYASNAAFLDKLKTVVAADEAAAATAYLVSP